jgi:hypothetical protein
VFIRTTIPQSFDFLRELSFQFVRIRAIRVTLRLRLRRAVSIRGFSSSLPQLLSAAHAPRGFGVDNPG